MRTRIQIIALVFALGVAAFWCLRGPNLRWTKTSVPVKHVDPVTDIEVNVYVPRFVPGVDFLAAGLAVAALLAGSSFLFRKTPAASR